MDFWAFYLASVLSTGQPPPVEITVTRTSYSNVLPTHILRREFGQTEWISPSGAVIFWDSLTEELKLRVTAGSSAYPVLIGDSFDYDGEFTAIASVTDWGHWRLDQWIVPCYIGFVTTLMFDLIVGVNLIVIAIFRGRRAV